MQATNFLTLRGGYVHHHSSNLRPSIMSYSLLRHHNYVALRSSSTVRKNCFTSNQESHGKPRNEYMEEVFKWVTLSPLNEEYPEELKKLLPIFNADGLFHYRTIVQVKWLLKQSDILELIEVPKFSQGACSFIKDIIHEFDESDSEVIELAFGMMLKEAINCVIFPRMTRICNDLLSKVDDDHVSRAPPYTLALGEELFSVAVKLRKQAKCVRDIVILGQFRSGGDNYNGDRYTEIDWRRIEKEFVTNSLGLEFDSNVDSENHINKLILEIVNFNKILVEFSNELHSYISSGYFKLEGDSIKLEINKINLLSLDNMIKTLDIKRPHSKRGLAGILLTDMPQDLVGVLGYSLVGYEAMRDVLKKLK